MHALPLQRMRRVEHALDRAPPVAFLALRDVAAREFEIVENACRLRPLPEHAVVLEEMVVAERGVRDHQRLHRRRVLLHQIGDARIRIDDDLVGEPHQAATIGVLVHHEPLAERPVLVDQRHAVRRVHVEHLLGGDHLDAVLVDVEPKFLVRDLLDRVVAPTDGIEVPVQPLVEEVGFLRENEAHARSTCFARGALAGRRANSSRNTGKMSRLSLTWRMARCCARSATRA